jgi:glycosyltransferase involved in cell wall biosynthesis
MGDSIRLKNYIALKGLNFNKVRVNEWIKNEKKIEVLNKSTMLILPSHTEGIPNVILEAMATKTPIVSTAVGGLEDMLVDGENSIVVEPKNPKNLSQKIQKCLEDPDLRKKISENGYKLIEKKHDIEILKKEFSRIVTQICKNGRI